MASGVNRVASPTCFVTWTTSSTLWIKCNVLTSITYIVKKPSTEDPHQRLHIKLEAIGKGGKVLHWITSCLTDRDHHVNIKTSASDWLPVMSAVPRYGSVLGPVLFLIYINDIDNNLESAPSLFADDAKIYKIIKIKEDVETLQRDLKWLDNWSHKWLLSFNVDKCNTMHVGHHYLHTEYHLKAATLNKSSGEKIWALQCLIA